MTGASPSNFETIGPEGGVPIANSIGRSCRGGFVRSRGNRSKSMPLPSGRLGGLRLDSRARTDKVCLPVSCSLPCHSAPDTCHTNPPLQQEAEEQRSRQRAAAVRIIARPRFPHRNAPDVRST
jgi:hypothetical protein